MRRARRDATRATRARRRVGTASRAVRPSWTWTVKSTPSSTPCDDSATSTRAGRARRARRRTARRARAKRLFASRATDGALSRDRATQVKFGALVRDDEVANTFEALNGTLRAAKKRGKLTFAGELLLQGAHDDVDVVVVERAGAT